MIKKSTQLSLINPLFHVQRATYYSHSTLTLFELGFCRALQRPTYQLWNKKGHVQNYVILVNLSYFIYKMSSGHGPLDDEVDET
jgi:hypothetical protein